MPNYAVMSEARTACLALARAALADKRQREAADAKHFGAEFRRWREALGLTKIAMAQRLGVHRHCIREWECGRRYPCRMMMLRMKRLRLSDPGAQFRCTFCGADVLKKHVLHRVETSDGREIIEPYHLVPCGPVQESAGRLGAVLRAGGRH
jgi:DNA-binding transcriptional regulator YiaG